ncbi:nephrocystin-1 isoform X1 [Scleropages formosus]|uniref:nephrocystin-1 isoform X1 n=1 Tax=Scleropages formosus TaxID=113540 RepID=UPI0010FAA3D4|nr:nephrocystin-1 isoform X1 [Scleropages formosus]
MPPKRKGPLQTLQRDTDDIKRQVDSLAREVQQLDRTSDGEGLTEASGRCSSLQKSVEETAKTLRKLTKADEPAPVGNYEGRKLDEERRLQAIRQQLQSLSLKLSMLQKPTQSEKAATHASSRDEPESEDEGEESEEEEEDDDDEEEEEQEEEDQADEEKRADFFVVACSFKGEQEGDLTVQKGDLLRILSKNPDGWWLAQDSKGRMGVVPKNFLKVPQEEEDEEDDEDESDAEEESADEQLEPTTKSSRSHHSNWDVVRKAITEMNATDVLSAMGAIPAGFRPSTLSRMLAEGNTYRSSYYIQPELSRSQLAFKDLFWDPDTGSVRPRVTRTSLTLTLWSCRMIPGPGVGVQVLSRHVRLCVFDGVRVLSNIHTVRACHSAKNPKTWTFSPRTAGILPSLLDGDCFVRSDAQSPELGVLFELGVTYIRNSTGERGDLSCGWAFLKLFDASGVPVPYRMCELSVSGGTPYEKGVDVDPSISSRATGSVFHQMLASRKQPKLLVKLRLPNTRTRATLNLLPDSLVGSTCSAHLLALYRQVLADALVRDRPTIQNADLICHPVLATFPEVLDHTDLLDALRSTWAEKESGLRRSHKRDGQRLKGLFVEVYMSTVFPLLRSSALPSAQWANEEQETLRWNAVFASASPGVRDGLSVLLSANPVQEAFDITQVTYDFLGAARRGVETT